MKTKIAFEYDEDEDGNTKVLRMLSADDAWYALSQISDVINKFYKDDFETLDPKDLLNSIGGIIEKTPLEELWG